MNQFYNPKNYVLFGIGAVLAGKIMVAFSDATTIVESGGTCNIVFKFDKDNVSGTVRYSIGKNAPKSVKFENIYELVAITTDAKQELS